MLRNMKNIFNYTLKINELTRVTGRFFRVLHALFDLILYIPVNNLSVMSGQGFVG